MCENTLLVIKDYRILHQLARSESQLGEIKNATEHYEQALDLCPLEDQREKAAILNNLAALKINQNKLHEATELYQKSKGINERIGEIKGQAQNWQGLANIKAIQEEIDEAISFYTKSSKLFESSENLKEKAEILVCLGNTKINLDKPDKIEDAINDYREAREIFHQIGYLTGEAITWYHLAVVKTIQGRIKQENNLNTEAMELFDEGSDLCNKSLQLFQGIGDIRGKAKALYQLAAIKKEQGHIPDAINLYTESLELDECIDNLQGKAATLAMRAQLLAIQSNYTTALQDVHQSLEILEGLSSPEVNIVRKILAEMQKEAEE